MDPIEPYHLPLPVEPAVMKDNNERRGSGSGVATTLNKMQIKQLQPYHLPPVEPAVAMQDNNEGHRTSVATRQQPSIATNDDPSFWKLVDHRVSVRSFTNQPVPDTLLDHCLRKARLAPSAGNLQAYQVVIVKRQDQRNALAQAAVGQSWIAQAPVVLVFVADLEQSAQKYHDRGRVLYAVQDATIAAVYLQLALEAVGLSSCWVGAFRDKEVAEIVGIKSSATTTTNISDTCEYPSLTNFRPVVVMPIGYAAERHERHHHHHRHHHRRSLKQFVHHGVLGGKEEHGAKRAREEHAKKLPK